MEDIFQKGCLVQLSASVWGACRKIKPEQLTNKAISREWLHTSKMLVNPESLKPLQKVVNSARSYLLGASLPFPIHGMVFVPKDMISRVDDQLTEYKDDFFGEVEIFAEDYDRLRNLAMAHLGDLFNETDYPIEIRQKFSFVWRFIILDVPNGKAGILSPEVYEREKEKFINTMEEARQLAVQSLREEFASMVERVTERFSAGSNGAPKVFKKSTVEKFYEYFETFKDRNIFMDSELADLVSKAQNILGGKTAEEIRDDEKLKERIRTGMLDVEKAMAETLIMPRRRIIMN